MSQSSKVIIWIIVVLIVVWAGYSLFGSGERETSPIKIGVLFPLSGDAAYLGENGRTALSIGVDELNAAGGVEGRPIELVFEDGKCDGKEAVNAANKLIDIDKVSAVIGGICSAETLAIAPLAESAMIPLVSPASTNPKITEAGDYTFRFVASDLVQGRYAAEYVYNTLGKKKVATIYCLADFCVGIKDVFASRFKELGGTILGEEGVSQDSRDLRTQITKVKALNPELVYFVGYTQGSIIGLKQMRELGVTVPVFGSDAWDDAKIPSDAGAASEGAMYTVAANQALPQSFTDEMSRRTNGQDIVVYSPRAYDILKALAMIMERVGTDGVKVKAELYGLTDYQGIADKYSLDDNGDLEGGSFTVKKYSGGKIVEVTQ